MSLIRRDRLIKERICKILEDISNDSDQHEQIDIEVEIIRRIDKCRYWKRQFSKQLYIEQIKQTLAMYDQLHVVKP